MKIIGIYKIINKVNNKYYVGRSIDINHRKSEHFNDLIKNKHINKHLQKSFNKHGIKNFDFEIIEQNIGEKQLFNIEQKYLDIAKGEIDKCYNIVFVAGQTNVTAETRKKLSLNATGRKHSEETKQKLSKINKGKNTWSKDRKVSNEEKKKLRENHADFKGINNPKFNHNIHHFINIETKEEFIGTNYDFSKKYKLNNLNLILNNKVKSIKKWTFIKRIS